MPESSCRYGSQFLSDILDTVDALVVVLDIEGRIIFFNQACEQATGYQLAEVHGKIMWEVLLPTDERESIQATFLGLHIKAFPLTSEQVWVAKDGQHCLATWSYTSLMNANGEVTHLVGTGTNFPMQKPKNNKPEVRKALRHPGRRGTGTVDSVVSASQVLSETPESFIDMPGDDEEPRLEALRATGLLDSPPERAFDRLTELACRLLHVPVALVSLIDQDRQFFKSSRGLSDPWESSRETPLSHSFCQHVVASHTALVVNDARRHPLVWNNLAVSEMGVIAYLGVPLITPNGQVLGSFCVIDDKPRTWTVDDLAALQELAEPAMTEIAVRQYLRERDRAEQALRESEERLALIVRATNHGVWDWDLSQNTIWWNERYDNLFGPRPKITTHSRQWWIERIHPNDRSRILEKSQFLLASKETLWQEEYRFRRRDNTYAHVIEHAYIGRNQSGQATRIVGMIVDITEYKQLEEQLRQSQKMESLGTLAGGIAHEFNNVLAAIMGFTQLGLLNLPSHHPVSSYLQNVFTSSQRAKELVHQILTFTHQTSVDLQPLPFVQIVREGLDLVHASLPSTIVIETSLVDDAGTILADSTQMHQVLMNLCANAEYAMREREGLLQIRVDSIELDATFASQHPPCQPGPYVRLAIRDTGSGMAPEVLERIFDPFYTTKDVGEGSGMGLAIVHGIVMRHGGAITVESIPGRETTFTVYLPCTDEPVLAPTETLQALPHGTGCLLVVDDEPLLTKFMEEFLTQLGYEIQAYTDPQKAFMAFEEAPDQFDLVITDQTMPHVTGEQLAQKLRHIRSNIPIILCTGFNPTMDADKAQTLGIDAFCMKPLETQELVDTIQHVLVRHQSNGE